jgi:hypothetical protein
MQKENCWTCEARKTYTGDTAVTAQCNMTEKEIREYEDELKAQPLYDESGKLDLFLGCEKQ